MTSYKTFYFEDLTKNLYTYDYTNLAQKDFSDLDKYLFDIKDCEEQEKSIKRIQDLPKLFQDADQDNSGGLNEEEFCEVIQPLYGKMTKDDLKALHMKIDTNSDGKVDLSEFVSFFLIQNYKAKSLDYRKNVFPRTKPSEFLPLDSNRFIFKIICLPVDSNKNYDEGVLSEQTRTYQPCNYLTITKDGTLNHLTGDFSGGNFRRINLPEISPKTNDFCHKKSMKVVDTAYIKDLQQLAVCTSEREVIFYEFDKLHTDYKIKHRLINHDSDFTTINYSSSGKQAMFFFGDSKGHLSILVSFDVAENGLFDRRWLEENSRRSYPVVQFSTLLKNNSKNFIFVRKRVLNDICSNMHYFSKINSFAICGASSESMSLSVFKCDSGSARTQIKTETYKSEKEKKFFTCVEYSRHSNFLMTGGKDGCLRVWSPSDTSSCIKTLVGHETSVTHIIYNDVEKVFISISANNIRVWSDSLFTCTQSFSPDCLQPLPISSVCYNFHNNELLVANRNIAKYRGRGTDVFQESVTSFEMPVCDALYHHIYKQLVSVSMNGLVTVWDVLTGKAEVNFKVNPVDLTGHTAITFDETQRKLITTSQDRKVRIWNFNSGRELDVLPDKVPEDVTGLFCREERLYISSKNSKSILVLDFEGKDKKRLQHRSLSEICSMELHEPFLIAASRNGNFVIWNLCTDAPPLCDSVRVSPQKCTEAFQEQNHCEQPFEKKVRRTSLSMSKNEKNVGPIVLSLKTREANMNTVTLLISAGGYISAWSFKVKTEQVGSFRAVETDDAVITYMSTDQEEKTLLTGDSTGRVCLWDIQDYGFNIKKDKSHCETQKEEHMSLCPPPLLRSWQASLSEIVSVVCDPTCEKIFTAGLDHNVKRWTNTGYCVGIFGKDEWNPGAEPLTQPTTEQNQENKPDSPETDTEADTEIDIEIPLTFSPSDIPGLPEMLDEPERSTFPCSSQVQNLFKDIEKNRDDVKRILGEWTCRIGAKHEEQSTSKAQLKPHPPMTSEKLKNKPLPPISDKGHLTRTQLKPHPPMTSEMLDREPLPPISDKGQLTRTQLKPHPPKTPHLTGPSRRRLFK